MMDMMKLPGRFRYLVAALIVILVGHGVLLSVTLTTNALSSTLTGTIESPTAASASKSAGVRSVSRNTDSEDGLSSSLTGIPTESPTEPPTLFPTTAPKLKPTTGIESKSAASASVSESAGFHSEQVSFLDLLPWEEDSLEFYETENPTKEKDSCHPPPGVPTSCCLGSYSSGGGTNPKYRRFCSEAFRKDYAALKEHTVQEMAKYPIKTEPALPCDICNILNLMVRRNITLAFSGDSMQSQVVDGLLCEMTRRNYTVTQSDSGKLHEDGGPFKKLSSIRDIYVSSPTWKANETAHIRFLALYKFPMVFPEDEERFVRAGDVLVLGFGLHWGWGRGNTRGPYGEYVNEVANILRKVRNASHVQLVVHRETSAQHFDAPTGDHSTQTKNSSGMCMPTDFDDSHVWWRENAFKQAAADANYSYVVAGPDMPPKNSSTPRVVVAPWFNFTGQHHQMHPFNPLHPSQDCTHYCASPSLYLPVWRGLRIAMDSEFED
jgi:hypothetical protein